MTSDCENLRTERKKNNKQINDMQSSFKDKVYISYTSYVILYTYHLHFIESEKCTPK